MTPPIRAADAPGDRTQPGGDTRTSGTGAGHIDSLETLDRGAVETKAEAEGSTRRDAPGSGPQLFAGRSFGSYRLVRPLGRGGFGQVWEADHEDTGRRVALKVMTAREGDGTVERQRFEREARMAASVSHPNCVYVFGAEEIEGHPSISMELVPGGTLQDLIRSRGRLEAKDAVDFALELLDGLQAAHEKGVIHRDVKPSNCFLDAHGRAKVGDFGLSRTLETDVHLTATGMFLGTPAYASPEQVRGQAVDFRTDLYSLGATLYALLAGKAPFEGTQLGAVLSRILTEPPPPLSSHGVQVPGGLQRTVDRMMAKDGAARYPSYEAARAALVPYSSKGLGAASLAKRFAALMLDMVVLLPLSLPAMHLTPRLSGPLVLGFLYYAVLEKTRGASVGKQVFGLTVTSATGSETGWRQILIRTSLYSLLGGSPVWLGLFLSDGAYGRFVNSPLSMLVQVAGYALLLGTMRRRNGFAGLHEILSRTRVTALDEQDRERVPTVSLSSTLAPATAPPVGPYCVKGTVWEMEGESLLLASDPVLERDVLVHRRPDGAVADRAGSGAGRLQWLQGSAGGWNAYEVPGGASLLSLVRTRGPLSWPEFARALVTLVPVLEEQQAGEPLALSRIWIDGLGRGKLLDFDAERGDATNTGDRFTSAEWRAFVHQLVLFALEGRVVPRATLPGSVPRVPLPEHARALVMRLCEDPPAESLADLASGLGAASDRVGRLNPGRRAAALTLASSVPLMAVLVALMWALLAGDTLIAATGVAKSLKVWREARASAPADPGRLHAAEVFLAHRYAVAQKVVEQPPSVSFMETLSAGQLRKEMETLSAEERAALDGVRSRLHAPPPAEVAAAEAALQLKPPPTPAFMGSMIFLIMSGAAAVASLLTAVAFRGGLGFLLAGISVQRRDGMPAGRLRCLARALVAWLPLLASQAVITLAQPHRAVVIAAALGAAAVLVLGAGYAVARPTRGLQDMAAGTVLVPK